MIDADVIDPEAPTTNATPTVPSMGIDTRLALMAAITLAPNVAREAALGASERTPDRALAADCAAGGLGLATGGFIFAFSGVGFANGLGRGGLARTGITGASGASIFGGSAAIGGGGSAGVGSMISNRGGVGSGAMSGGFASTTGG